MSNKTIQRLHAKREARRRSDAGAALIQELRVSREAKTERTERARVAGQARQLRRQRRGGAWEWATRGYAAAANEEILFDFQGSSGGINAALFTDLRKLRDRSRQEANDNPLVHRFLQMVRTHIIGPKGIKLQADFRDDAGEPDTETSKLVEEHFAEWGRRCDVSGQLSWVAVQQLVVETTGRDGESLVRFVRTTENKYGLALQILDVELLDERHVEELGNGRRIELGIEVDKWGRPHGYHLRQWRHQNGILATTITPNGEDIRLAAGDILHIYVHHHADQRRGVPWNHSVLRRLHMLDGYEEAEVVAARIGAAKGGFFESVDGEGYKGEGENDAGETVDEVAPGQFTQLPEGVTFKPYDPQHPTTAFDPFLKAAQRGIASGQNVAYTSLTGDLTGANYGSLRAGTLEERDSWKCLQTWITEALCQPVYEAWLDAAILNSAIDLRPSKRDDYLRVRWLSRGWSWLDPLKDVQAAEKALGLGLTTRTKILAGQGEDWNDTIETLKKEEDELAALGITLTASAEAPPPPAPPDDED